MLDVMNVFGNPNIGVYIFANNKVAIVPPGLPDKDIDKIREVLGVDVVVETEIAGMIINGVMVAGNDNGILLPRIVRAEEVDTLRRKIGSLLRIEILESKSTALGNLIVANSNAALVSTLIEEKLLDRIKEVLGVDKVKRQDLAGIPTVGSMLVVTNRGGLVHPGVSEEEQRSLQDLFEVSIDVGTVNFGVYFVRAGIVANDKGVLVGDETTGPELMKVKQALNIPE